MTTRTAEHRSGAGHRGRGGPAVRRPTSRERLAPLIRALRERGDAVLASELGRFRSELSGLTPDEREAVEALARGIVSKLLHDPIVRLKELSGPATRHHARVLAELFGIDPTSREASADRNAPLPPGDRPIRTGTRHDGRTRVQGRTRPPVDLGRRGRDRRVIAAGTQGSVDRHDPRCARGGQDRPGGAFREGPAGR